MARITVTDEELDNLIIQNAGEYEPFFDLDYLVEVRLGSGTVTVGELLDLKVGDTFALDRETSGYVLLVVGDVEVGEAEVIMRKNRPTARIVRLGA